MADARVACGGEPAVGLMYQLSAMFYAADPLLEKPIGYSRTVGGGSVVNHNYFYVLIRLGTYRLQGIFYVFSLVVERYDDGY